MKQYKYHEIVNVFSAAQAFLEVSVYECLCGTGITDHDNCPYHQASDKLSDALAVVGYQPSWYELQKDVKE